MASGKEILLDDLPSELSDKKVHTITSTEDVSWTINLQHWVDEQLAQGNSNIIDQALPEFEKILLERALHFTQGRKQEAAKKLGWGRNTLTRKLKELGV
jgi:two-component system nitrogen regulation response regulator GlnG